MRRKLLAITIEHDAEGSMGAMRMEYKVADPALIANVTVGQRVSGRVEARAGQNVFVRVEPVPGNPGR